MIEILLPSSLVSLILLVWFKSTAFLEYSKLFGLGGVFYVNAYEESLEKNPLDSYQEFLVKNFPCFITKLITCPLCLSFWLSLIVAISLEKFYFFPLYNVTGLLLYGAINKLIEE
jgi:hypothetical protein